MFRRLILPVIFLVLGYGFWLNPNIKEIAAGVAIFLFGMLFLEEGFRAFSSGFLERLLNLTTNRLWKAITFGIVSTTIMQSSSLVSLITISFLSTGLIWLTSGIGIIFGANLGTTTGAWLVAGFGLKVDMASYAMPMLAFGIVLVFQRSKPLKGIGYVLSGLGFLFLGIHYMKEGFEAFKDTLDLAKFAIGGFGGLLIFVAIGTLATVILQSSHATLVLIITALAAFQITYENALALAIGANIGTTITAILGSLTSNYQGRRLAAAHLIFNAVTGAIAIIFMVQIVWMVDEISKIIGIGVTDYTLKLAVFHSLFNVIGVLVMVPLVPRLVAFLHRRIPKPHEKRAEPKYINDAAFEFPETLLEAVRKETIHLYANAFEIMAHGLNLPPSVILSTVDLDHYTKTHKDITEFDLDQSYNNMVKILYASILEFISTAQTQLPPDLANRLFELRQSCLGIVSGVKEVKHLRKNILNFCGSNNEYIRQDYNALRVQIAEVMREIHVLQNTHVQDRDILALDEFKVAVEHANHATTIAIDTLIREQKISAAMATSLMTDLGYARNAVWHLADVAKTLFGPRDKMSKEAQDLVALTHDDVEDLHNEENLHNEEDKERRVQP